MSKFGYFAAGVLVATLAFWGKVLIAPQTSDAAMHNQPASVIMAPTRLLHEQAPRDLPVVKGDLS
ncbi:hypothetical protein, partial [Klebsiella aerogenes]|uniref:hypothetical protein n=1 Tax=Klebsiella aerogenes TaxID=548 RepID=UPI0013D7A35A